VAKGYSKDLRERAVAMVEEGESRREVARMLNLAPSTAVRWLDRWNRTGSVAAKPGTGHSRSPLKVYERWLLDLVAKEPDLTLEEIRDRLRHEKKLVVATSSVWRFYDPPQDHIQKKSCTRPSRIGLTSPLHARS
jgi:transposase